MKFIRLQKRRLLFGTFFFFLSGIVIMDNGRHTLLGVIVLSALFALIAFAMAVVAFTLFPRFRTVFELSAVVFLIVTILNKSLPNVDILDGWRLLVVAVVFSIVEYFLYGLGQHKLPAFAGWKGVSRFQTQLSPEEAWKRLVPDPAAPGSYYSGKLHEMTPGDDPESFHMLWKQGGTCYFAQEIRVTESEPHHRFSYEFFGEVSSKNRPMHRGSWQVEIKARADGGSDIEIVENLERARFGAALFIWFDDLARQTAESAKAALDDTKDRSVFALSRKFVDQTT